MWRDPGAWIAIGVSLLFIVVGLLMQRIIVRVLKATGDAETETPGQATGQKVKENDV